MPEKSITIPKRLTRVATVMLAAGGTGAGMISVSSDEPYLRSQYVGNGEWEDYYEVLDHSALDDERLKAGLPILFNHDRDLNLGNAKEFLNDGHKVSLPLDKIVWASGEFAENKKKDVESGALPHTSVGYEITGDGVCTGALNNIPVYRFPWKIWEGSVVTIPADATVGTGKQLRHQGESEETVTIPIKQIDNENNSANNETTESSNKPTPPMKLSKLAKLHFAADTEDAPAGGASTGATKEQLAAAAKAAIAEHKARCKRIDEFVKALGMSGPTKNPAWEKAAGKIAEKHKDGDANFEDFRTEANQAFVAPGHVDAEEDGSDERSGRIQVMGERVAPGRKSIGQLFVESKELKETLGNGRKLRKGHGFGVDFPGREIIGARGKANLATRAGFTSADLSAVNVTVNTQILPLGVQRLTILDVIGSGTIGTAAYKYARENGFGTIDGVAVEAGKMPRAKAVGERGLKPTWEPDLSTETANVAKIAITTKVPDEFLSDFPSAMSYIDDRLPFMVDTETEFEILYGDGLNDNLKGIFNTFGVQTRPIDATSDITVAASMRKGLTDIEVGAQFQPDFFGFHPYDWETAQLLKDSQNRFLAGGPYYIPLTDGVYVERYTFWGKPVVVSTAISYGFPICGAGKIGASALIREGMRIEMTNSNEDDFRRNLICLRAEHRLALPVYRPVAFLYFTGFPARA